MTTPKPLQLCVVASHPNAETSCLDLNSAPRLWPTDKVEPLILEASISQAFAGRRLLEPVRRQLALRGYWSFGYLVGLTREEIFKGSPRVFKVRQAFVAELQALGFVFSTTPLPVKPWRRHGQLFKKAEP
jgi:hypothetical protein